jgi:hypothetical protein
MISINDLHTFDNTECDSNISFAVGMILVAENVYAESRKRL